MQREHGAEGENMKRAGSKHPPNRAFILLYPKKIKRHYQLYLLLDVITYFFLLSALKLAKNYEETGFKIVDLGSCLKILKLKFY